MMQQTEIVIRPVITEHRQMAVWCESCRKMYDSPLPGNIRKAGLCGRHWLERIWTVIATCRQQNRSIFEFLSTAISTWLSGTTPPTLLPSPA